MAKPIKTILFRLFAVMTALILLYIGISIYREFISMPRLLTKFKNTPRSKDFLARSTPLYLDNALISCDDTIQFREFVFSIPKPNEKKHNKKDSAVVAVLEYDSLTVIFSGWQAKPFRSAKSKSKWLKLIFWNIHSEYEFMHTIFTNTLDNVDKWALPYPYSRAHSSFIFRIATQPPLKDNRPIYEFHSELFNGFIFSLDHGLGQIALYLYPKETDNLLIIFLDSKKTQPEKDYNNFIKLFINGKMAKS